MNEAFDLSLVIACYQEEPHLATSVAEIEAVIAQTRYSYELIFIDDCSKDNTATEIRKICADRPNYRSVFHNPNVGRGGTVKEGLLMAKGRYAGFLDIDLEVHARYIPTMITWLEQGYDMVTVERIEKLIISFNELLRFILSNGYKKLAHLFLGIKAPDSEAGYKFFNMSTMREVIAKTDNKGWFWDTEIVYRAEEAGKKIKSVQAVFERRGDKASTVRVIPDSIAYLKAGYHFKKELAKANK